MICSVSSPPSTFPCSRFYNTPTVWSMSRHLLLSTPFSLPYCSHSGDLCFLAPEPFSLAQLCQSPQSLISWQCAAPSTRSCNLQFLSERLRYFFQNFSPLSLDLCSPTFMWLRSGGRGGGGGGVAMTNKQYTWMQKPIVWILLMKTDNNSSGT